MAEPKSREERSKIYESILDTPTLWAITKLRDKMVFKELGWIINAGKESRILVAYDKDDKPLVVKIYMVETSNFGKMEKYIIGDPRFKGLYKSKRKLVYAWCQKEYKNLHKARLAGVRVPEPIAFRDNVLVMEMVTRGEEVAPRLVDHDLENPQEFFDLLIQEMRRIHHKAGLVHADLSEHNILVTQKDGRDVPVIIDWGQAVLHRHPFAREFFERDCKNIARYFSKIGVDVTPERVIELVEQPPEE